MTEQFKQFHKTARYDWFVSNHGTIKRVANGVINNGKTKIVKTYVTGGHHKQYQAISINDAPEKYVHRIVAMMFLDNPENKPTINHKDNNKNNNHVSNLEWSTYSENLKASYDTEVRKAHNEPRRSLRKITFAIAQEIRQRYANGEANYYRLSLDYAIHAATVRQIVLWKTYTKP